MAGCKTIISIISDFGHLPLRRCADPSDARGATAGIVRKREGDTHRRSLKEVEAASWSERSADGMKEAAN
jgi:hypothetical protein